MKKVYLYYNHYEIFELLRFVQYSKKEDLNLLGKSIKVIPLVFFSISMYYLQYYLMNI